MYSQEVEQELRNQIIFYLKERREREKKEREGKEKRKREERREKREKIIVYKSRKTGL